jgi:hypothetical protein
MLDVAARFDLILSRLQQAVARFLLREAALPYAVWLGTRLFVAAPALSPHRRIPAETWHLLIARAQRLALRFRRLVQAWQAGTLKPPRPARRPGADAGSPAAAKTTAMRLPQERGWINKRIPEAAPCAGLLGALLQWPALERFHAEVPRAGRLLRPICHALGQDPPPWLRLPPRRPAPRPAAPTPAAPPVPQRPLQPYVRAAARAWKRFNRPASRHGAPPSKTDPA